jgi:hypothetical protein
MTRHAAPDLTGGVAQLSPGWFSAVLDSAVASSVAIEPLAIQGAAADLYRARLAYADDSAGGPRSLVLKARGDSPVKQAMDAALGLFERERRFYADVADRIPVATPACWGTADVLLLEDLDGLRAGDQVVGLRIEDAERLVDVLADMHAAFWERPITDDDGWALSLTDPAVAAMLVQLVASGIPKLQAHCAGRVPTATLTAAVAVAGRFDEVLARCAEGPQTLVHGDCRLDNVFFAADGTPVLVDWQLAGRTRGTHDIAYLLSGSMLTEKLATAWQDLLRRWHAGLVARGVRDYSWEACVEHYRQSLLYTLAPGIAMLGEMQLAEDDRGLADALIVRTLEHAAALEAFSAL